VGLGGLREHRKGGGPRAVGTGVAGRPYCVSIVHGTIACVFNGQAICSSGSNTVPIAGGALSRDTGGNATVTNVTMSNNWASYGGAIDQSGGTTTLINATLSGNSSVSGGGIDQGGGVIGLTKRGNSSLRVTPASWSRCAATACRSPRRCGSRSSTDRSTSTSSSWNG
jgi:hypothetical protein